MKKLIEENSTVIIQTNQAFYNPAQEVNRDISIMAINSFLDGANFKEPKKCIFESMSATGLRGIRYAKEISTDSVIFMNDIDSDAVKEIKENFKINNIEYVAMAESGNKYLIEQLSKIQNSSVDSENINNSKHDGAQEVVDNVRNSKRQKNHVFLLNGDCNSIMANNCLFFHVIDVDPFGYFTKYLPFAFKSIKNNGLICLTATDTAVLCTNRQKCMRKYDVLIRKVPCFSEMALRAALSTVARIAAIYDCGITPLLSISVDFYVRLFLKVERRTPAVKKSLKNCVHYFICCCGYRIEVGLKENSVSLICPICGSRLQLCGPLWSGKLHEAVFVEKMRNTFMNKRIGELIKLVLQENECFGFYHIPRLCSLLKFECIPMIKLVSELFNRGYKVSFTHCRDNSVKTDCSYQEILEIIKQFFNDKGSIKENKKASEICGTKYNRAIIHDNKGPLSKPSKI